MQGYFLTGWDNFFIACSGATAGLAGLLFVAMSINLSKILSTPGQAARAGETFVPLAVVLGVSITALVPGESLTGFGIKLVAMGGVAWLFTTYIEIRAIMAGHFHKPLYMVIRVAIEQPATVTVPIAGITLLLGHGGGLYWLVPGFLFTFAGAMLNAWVLLVEIMR